MRVVPHEPLTKAKGASVADKVRARGANGKREAHKSESGKRIKLKIEPLPVHAPWEVTPGGPELFAALKDVERRYARAARAHDADPLLQASARILRALVLTMALGNDKALTAKPKSKRSLNAWARAFLRCPEADTRERAHDAEKWLFSTLGIKANHIFDTQLERHEAVDRFLAMIEKIRRDRENAGNELLTAHEGSAAELVYLAESYFPHLFTFDLRARETYDQWLALVRRVAGKLSWEKDSEGVMRAVLRACGMSETEARALGNFQDWRTKHSQG